MHKPPRLTVISGDDIGLVFGLSRTPLVIGRSMDVEISIDGVGVSRRHARIDRTTEGDFTVTDLDSSNGTFVNDRRVNHALLREGDRVRIGRDVIFEFQRGMGDDRETVEIAGPEAG